MPDDYIEYDNSVEVASKLLWDIRDDAQDRFKDWRSIEVVVKNIARSNLHKPGDMMNVLGVRLFAMAGPSDVHFTVFAAIDPWFAEVAFGQMKERLEEAEGLRG